MLDSPRTASQGGSTPGKHTMLQLGVLGRVTCSPHTDVLYSTKYGVWSTEYGVQDCTYATTYEPRLANDT